MQNNIEQVELHQHMEEAYLSYSMAVIVDRALPDVRDGCLPIHRRLLYAMYNKGISHTKPFSKSSEPVSETMKLHQHGDGSIYGSLALLTDRNETLLHPLLEGDGSFGKVYSTDSPSSMRYTFCRLHKFAEEMFSGIKQDAVRFIGDDHKQPIVLPTTFPHILVKPNAAIAVGEACNWGSFPLAEVCAATIAYIENKDIDLLEYLTPDFSTGAQLIYDAAQLRTIYETGKGKIKLRSKYRYCEEENLIEIYEIPYSTTAQKIISEIISKLPIFKNILDVRDETGYNKDKEIEELKIAIDVKKNTNIEVLMAQLFKHTSLENSFSFNMNCLVNNRPKVLGIKAVLDEWISFRKQCIINVLNDTIEKQEAELHLLLGLEKILLNIDKTIEIIRFSDDDKVLQELMIAFNIDERQAQYISNIKLKNINKDYITTQIKDIEALKKKVEMLKNNIQSDEYLNAMIIYDLNRVKDAYGKDRCTEIVYQDTITPAASTRIVEDYTATSVLTKEMYYKKCRRFAEIDKQRVKDGDRVINIMQCSNAGKIIFISNLGNAYMMNLDDMEEKTASAMGVYLPTLLPLETDEIILGMIATDNYKGDVLIVYSNGKIARVSLQSYKTKTNRTKLSNCLSTEDTDIVMITQIVSDVNIKLTDNFGNVKIINTSKLKVKSTRNTMGVTAWNSKKQGFSVIQAEIYKEGDK